MKTIIAYTDGGCRGNGKEDAIGAYGITMSYTDPQGTTHTKEISKAFRGVTNNQMELQAVIECLKALREQCEVILMTDSKYVCNAINQNWLEGWKKRGWVNSSKQPVKNRDQWELLSELIDFHKVKFFWVKGHSDNEGNQRADELCNIAMDKFLK